jgi:hypothetical protein
MTTSVVLKDMLDAINESELDTRLDRLPIAQVWKLFIVFDEP